MDLPYIPEDIPIGEKGNVDVSKEMEYIDILREAGYDVSEMEDLLITDIDRYKERRSSMIEVYNTMDAGGFGPGIELDLDPEDTKEEDILLYGDPLIDHPDEDDNVGISLEDHDITPPSPEMDEEEDLLDLSLKNSDEVTDRSEKPKEPEHDQIEEIDNKIEKNDVSPPDQEQRIASPRRTHKVFFIGVSAVVIVTLLVAVSYLYMLNDENGEGPEDILTANFTISDIDPRIGDILNLSASSIDGDITYEWQIIPKHYQLVNSEETSSSVEVYFKRPGSYRVDLKVTIGQEELTEHRFLEVDNREIMIERERYGDTSRYDLTGHMVVENVDDMIQEKNIYQFETLDIDFWTEKANPMTISISDGTSQGKDGLGMEYHKMERNTDQFLRFSGTINRKSGEYSSIAGHSTLSQQNHIDLFNQLSFRTFSDTSTHITIPVTSQYTIDYDLDESMILYPSLGGGSNDFRIEDIIEGRNISVGEEGIARWGPYDLTWKAVEMDILLDEPSIKVEFLMDQVSKNDLKLEDFIMIHWISSDISSPARTILNATTKKDVDHPSEIYLFQEMVSFTPGNDFVIYGSIDHRHQTITKIDEIHSGLGSEFHNAWNMIPKLGTQSSSIPAQFGPEIALQAILDTPSYQGWSINKDDLLVSYSNFSNIDGVDQWDIIIAEPDNEWAWNDTVRNGKAEGGMIIKIAPLSIERNDIPEILTYSGAEKALYYILPDLDREATTKIYGKAVPAGTDKIKLMYNSISARVDHPYPRIGLVDPSLGGSITYCLVIESFDGSMEVGLDITNGQISYILERNIR